MTNRDRRGVALTRLLQILTLMHGGGRVTQRDLAVACNCSERQIGRDLNVLRDAEIHFDCDQERGYYLEPGESLVRLSLSVQEAMALLLARQSIVGRAGLPFAHSAQNVFDKVAALLPPKLRAQLADEQAVAYHGGGKRNYADAPWGRLLAAMHRRDRLEMNYYTISRDVRSTRCIDPYHIVWVHGYCELIAYCHTRREVLFFALNGILDVRNTGETFEVPPTFSIADYLHGASGPMLGDQTNITVQFDAEVARWARSRAWEFPHTLTDQPDGSVVLHGSVRGLSDIRKEVLTWGRHACVLAPRELRDAILAEARALVCQYQNDEKI